ncbi:MAG: hypothetical protein Fur002_08890 [Anaerolineales bacterium]
MEGRLNFLETFTPEETTRALYKQWREKFILPMLIGGLIFGGGALIPALISANNAFLNGLFISVYGILAVVTLVQFSYQIRVWAFLLSAYAIGIAELYRYDVLGDSGVFFFAVIVVAAMMLSPKDGLIAAATVAATHAVFGYLLLNGIITPLAGLSGAPTFLDWVSGLAVILLFSSIVIIGFRRLEREFFNAQKQVESLLNELAQERENLEEKVLERTIKLRRVNEIGRAITATLDPDEALTRAAQLVGDEFEYYFAAIYLLDAGGQWVELAEASGEAGKVLRQNKFRVDARGKHLVAQAIRAREIETVSAESNQFARTENPLLPHTRSQIAIPMTIGERVIGALELHSEQENAFQPQDMDVYQNMANEIAVAYENAKLYKEAQQSLIEMRATQQQYLQNAWSSLASDRNMEYALGEQESDGQRTTLALALRDQIIGQIELTTLENLPPEHRELIESIATQAALALENARLVEESQSIAARERLANEIISKVWASATMESILQTTVRELGRALEVSEAEIHISMDSEHE